MNKGLYKHRDGQCIYWYETWKNSLENSGTTIGVWDWYNYTDNKWNWSGCEGDKGDYGQLIGAACLAQW